MFDFRFDSTPVDVSGVHTLLGTVVLTSKKGTPSHTRNKKHVSRKKGSGSLGWGCVGFLFCFILFGGIVVGNWPGCHHHHHVGYM